MTEETGYKKVDFKEAEALIKSGKPYVFLDVRTEEEYLVEHASGAALLPLDDIGCDSAARLIPDKDTAVLVYCRTGRRSKLAAERLENLGYRNIYDVGSLAGWPYGKDSGRV